MADHLLETTQLSHLATTYTDVYLVEVPLKATADHPAVRATRVVVELEGVPDQHGRHQAKVHVTVTGERIVQRNGRHVTSGAEVRVFGLAEEPVRYTLCRDAVLDSLRRHDLDLSDVGPFTFEQPWEEYARSSAAGAVNLSGAVSRYLLGGDKGAGDLEDDRF